MKASSAQEMNEDSRTKENLEGAHGCLLGPK
jgi:hypothetical protein